MKQQRQRNKLLTPLVVKVLPIMEEEMIDTIYIKMCDCSEIQKQKPDSTYALWEARIPPIGYHLGNVFAYIEPRIIWLPTQSQLQKMVGLHPFRVCGNFYEWLFDSVDDGWHVNHNHQNFTSREQLELAFCMSEKFGKVWTGNKWTTSQC